MSNLKDKEVTSKRLEELVDSSTSSKPLLGKDDASKTVKQGTGIDKNDRLMELSISLSSKEIEEDLYAMTGRKYNLKPKKRPEALQKKLDALFPKQVKLSFPKPISKDKEETSERFKELVDSTSSKPLLGKDDASKTDMQGSMTDKNDRRKKFSISLSSKEIEEDFYAFTGRKPPLNPKNVKLSFPKPISKDKEVTSERLKELVDSTSSKPLLGKDDASKTDMQGSVTDKNDRRKKFSISLSSKEIEEDFYAFTGRKPPLNPKKVKLSFPKPISKDKEVTSERLKELVDSTSSKPLLGKDDASKTDMQGSVTDKNDRRKKFSISLSSKEIEEDFYAFTGRKPPLNPKNVKLSFPKLISKDEEVTSERLKELVDSTSSKPLLRKDDASKTDMQGSVTDKNDRRKKFSISLSSKEIEEDFYAFTGRMPPLNTKNVKLSFPKPISKDKEVTSERPKELVDSSTSSKPLLGKDDASKTDMQGSVIDKNDRQKKFSISLSSKEIEEDFYAFTGRKPPLNPKKRPKVVQKQLDALFPGSRLSEISKDMYKVAE